MKFNSHHHLRTLVPTALNNVIKVRYVYIICFYTVVNWIMRYVCKNSTINEEHKRLSLDGTFMALVPLRRQKIIVACKRLFESLAIIQRQ